MYTNLRKIKTGVIPSMKTAYFVMFACFCLPVSAQKKSPRAAAPSPHQELRKRYDSLVCAIVLIQTERGTGTGFFTDQQGDIVTAAHVISTKDFKMDAQRNIDFDVKVDQQISITPHGQAKVPLPSDSVDVDKRESSTDLAFIHTTVHPPCFIPLGDATQTATGDHLLSIGFPGIDNGNPILYEGFLSGRFPHPPISVGQVNGQGIVPHYEVMKVQMPITAGASGSPVIDDSGHAIGVISEAPILWTQDLENITRVAGGTGSGIRLSGYDVTKTLGELAVVVREFESPGSGYAVPISGLKSTRSATPTASTAAH
jgi:S1-C subfamily serine protease